MVNTSAYPDIVNAYKNYMLQTAVLLGAMDDSRTHNDIEEILKFESQLAAVKKFWNKQYNRRKKNFDLIIFTVVNTTRR